MREKLGALNKIKRRSQNSKIRYLSLKKKEKLRKPNDPYNSFRT